MKTMGTTTGVIGPAGTASHEAAVKTGEKDIKFFRNLPHLFSALDVGEIDRAIVPIENIITGTICATVDELYNIEPVIIGEVIIPIKLCVACIPGTKKENIKNVLSDQNAIAQALGYLNRKFPDAEMQNIASAAHAMEVVAEKKLADCAAVGSEFAANQYGLKIIDKDIEDRKGNLTRYFILQMKGDSEPTGKDKTALFMIPKQEKDKPGVLFKMLKCFAERDINITNCVFRPSLEKLGTYNVYLAVDGHKKDKAMQEAFAELKKTAGIKIFGSFRKA
jgi:prephenate dehydratase